MLKRTVLDFQRALPQLALETAGSMPKTGDPPPFRVAQVLETEKELPLYSSVWHRDKLWTVTEREEKACLLEIDLSARRMRSFHFPGTLPKPPSSTYPRSLDVSDKWCAFTHDFHVLIFNRETETWTWHPLPTWAWGMSIINGRNLWLTFSYPREDVSWLEEQYCGLLQLDLESGEQKTIASSRRKPAEGPLDDRPPYRVHGMHETQTSGFCIHIGRVRGTRPDEFFEYSSSEGAWRKIDERVYNRIARVDEVLVIGNQQWKLDCDPFRFQGRPFLSVLDPRSDESWEIPLSFETKKSGWKDVLAKVENDLRTVASLQFPQKGFYCPVGIIFSTPKGLVWIARDEVARYITATFQSPLRPKISPEQRFVFRPMEVTLSTATPGSTVRYTLDGAEPFEDAPIYQKPLQIRGPVTLKARAFRDGHPPSGVTTAEFRRPHEPVPPGKTQPGLRYEYYEGAWRTLADFKEPGPTKTGIVPEVTVNPAERPIGFVMRFRGYVEVPEDSVYRFSFWSENQVQCFVGDVELVDPERGQFRSYSGEVGLRAGKHPFRFDILCRKSEGSISLSYENEEFGKRPVPANALSTDIRE